MDIKIIASLKFKKKRKIKMKIKKMNLLYLIDFERIKIFEHYYLNQEHQLFFVLINLAHRMTC